MFKWVRTTSILVSISLICLEKVIEAYRTRSADITRTSLSCLSHVLMVETIEHARYPGTEGRCLHMSLLPVRPQAISSVDLLTNNIDAVRALWPNRSRCTLNLHTVVIHKDLASYSVWLSKTTIHSFSQAILITVLCIRPSHRRLKVSMATYARTPTFQFSPIHGFISDSANEEISNGSQIDAA